MKTEASISDTSEVIFWNNVGKKKKIAVSLMSYTSFNLTKQVFDKVQRSSWEKTHAIKKLEYKKTYEEHGSSEQGSLLKPSMDG